jgi:5'-3' exonuclease
LKTLLVDGDILAFMASVQSETKVDWDGDGDDQVFVDEAAAKQAVDRLLDRWIAKHYASAIIVALSDPSRRYFRHDVYPAYKAHRTHGKPPELLPLVKQYMRDMHEAVSWPNLEADDVLGITATRMTAEGKQWVMACDDKDLDQIPGMHWNPRKDRLYKVNPGAGLRWFYIQSLTGDPVDGYPGCPGIGIGRAEPLIDKVLSQDGHFIWQAIVDTYHDRMNRKGKVSREEAEAFALSQARVAKILDADHYQNNEVKLWTP